MTFEENYSRYGTLKSTIKATRSALHDYTLNLKRLEKSQEELLTCFSALYNLARSDPNYSAPEKTAQDSNFAYMDMATHARSKTMNIFQTSCFLTDLFHSFSSSITNPLEAYLKQVEAVEGEVTTFNETRKKYDHYLTKLTNIGIKAAQEEDMSCAKINAKLQRNNLKLRNATVKFDRHSYHIEQTLSSISSQKGIEGSINPIVDRLFQFFVLWGAFVCGAARKEQRSFCRTKGSGGLVVDAGRESDDNVSDDDDPAFADDDFDYDKGLEVDDMDGADDDDSDGGELDSGDNGNTSRTIYDKKQPTTDLTRRNYLLPYKPRYSSITTFMDSENPKHMDGFLSVKRPKKLFSSKHYCVLKGRNLHGYLSENECLFGIKPIFVFSVQSVCEWEAKSPFGFVITDKHIQGNIYLKCESGDEKRATSWFKALLCSTSWDGGRSKAETRAILRSLESRTLQSTRSQTPGTEVVASKPEQSAIPTPQEQSVQTSYESARPSLPAPPPNNPFGDASDDDDDTESGSESGSESGNSPTPPVNGASQGTNNQKRTFAGGGLFSELSDIPAPSSPKSEYDAPPPLSAVIDDKLDCSNGNDEMESQIDDNFIDMFNQLAVDYETVHLDSIFTLDEISEGGKSKEEIRALWWEVVGEGKKKANKAEFVRFLTRLEELMD